jgi:hypothetical protein
MPIYLKDKCRSCHQLATLPLYPKRLDLPSRITKPALDLPPGLTVCRTSTPALVLWTQLSLTQISLSNKTSTSARSITKSTTDITSLLTPSWNKSPSIALLDSAAAPPLHRGWRNLCNRYRYRHCRFRRVCYRLEYMTLSMLYSSRFAGLVMLKRGQGQGGRVV